MKIKFVSDYRKEKSGYSYTGDWYDFDSDENDSRQAFRAVKKICLLTGAFLFLLTGGLMLNSEGSRTAWILLPYICTILPGALFFMAMLKYRKLWSSWMKEEGTTAAQRFRMNTEQYYMSVKRMRTCSLWMLVLSVWSFGAELFLCVFRNGITAGIEELLFLLLCAAMVFCSAVLTSESFPLTGMFKKTEKKNNSQ